MPVEFECRNDEPRRDPPVHQAAESHRPAKTRTLKDALLPAILLVGVSALSVALFLFVEADIRGRIALESERRLLIGRCFHNGIGGIGRLIDVWNLDRGLLAFPSGHTTPYPFSTITETACPQKATQASKEASHG